MDVGDFVVNVKVQKYCVNKIALPLKKSYHISIVLYQLMNYHNFSWK